MVLPVPGAPVKMKCPSSGKSEPSWHSGSETHPFHLDLITISVTTKVLLGHSKSIAHLLQLRPEWQNEKHTKAETFNRLRMHAPLLHRIHSVQFVEGRKWILSPSQPLPTQRLASKFASGPSSMSSGSKSKLPWIGACLWENITSSLKCVHYAHSKPSFRV